MVLIVARHCETKLNAQDRIQGSGFDYSLTAKGVMQAKVLGHKIYDLIYGHKIDIIYASDSKRAKQTAKNISPHSDIIIDNRLLPYNVGTADGLKFSELKHIKRFPNPLVYKNMENFFTYLKRTKEVLKDIMLNNENKVVLVVTHEDISAIFEKHLKRKSYLSVPKSGLENGEFRMYHVLNYNKDAIISGNFEKLGIVKHEGKQLPAPKLPSKQLGIAYTK
jgi:broad specificity phosphatase PhoE